jgi:hypothetical protein
VGIAQNQPAARPLVEIPGVFIFYSTKKPEGLTIRAAKDIGTNAKKEAENAKNEIECKCRKF